MIWNYLSTRRERVPRTNVEIRRQQAKVRRRMGRIKYHKLANGNERK